MTQHFLQSAKARTLSVAAVLRMTDREAEILFAEVRWPETNGKPVCLHCKSPTCYEARRPTGMLRFRCKACRKDFTLTSGTLFAFHKLSLKVYLAAVVIFCNEVKGKSALALSRELNIHYKSAFVLAHKLREAMYTETKGMILGGEGKTLAVDGAYFGGHVKPTNVKANQKDRRVPQNKSGKRKCVVVIREHDGRTVPGVFGSEAEAVTFIRNRVALGSEIMADEASDWNPLHSRYVVKRINHQIAFSKNGACTNQAESYFSRLRRAELGHHHRISDKYLVRYAQECAWREDHRRESNGAQVRRAVGLALNAPSSVDFCGYWQRHLKRGPAHA